LMFSLVINVIAFLRTQSGSRSGLIVALCALGIFMAPTFQFSESGFALVVCILLPFILYQLVTQFSLDKSKAALATQLENQLLRKSLQPHFLMNSLSLIGELVHQSPTRAEKFIQALGSEFRMLNEYAHLRLISLMQELELCHNYLEIMSTRLQQHCVLKITGDPSDIEIPPAIFLTSLENAFSHNKYRQRVDFELKITKSSACATMELIIPVGSQREHVGTGTGSQYIRQSLDEVFEARVQYHASLQNNAWTIIVSIPRKQ
jgi:LytS/YehU family sensor histidine kinase